MDTLTARQIGVDKLISLSKRKGYISFDDILDTTDSLKLPIVDVERISETLLLQGIIIRENNVHKITKASEGDSLYYDKSKLDYDLIFKEVLDIDPLLDQYIIEIKQIKPPQFKEVETLIYQAKDGNSYAHERIITMYLKVVIRMALWASKKYQLPIVDTICSGNIGLVIALKKFDPNGEYKFSTYAPLWIRQFILREAQLINPHIYFPVHMKDKLFSIYNIYYDHICEQCGEKNICNELVRMVAEKLECTLDESKEYINSIKLFESTEEQMLINEQTYSEESMFEENMLEN